MRKVIGYDLQDIRIKYQVSSMWGTIYPNWELLLQNLKILGPGYYRLNHRRRTAQEKGWQGARRANGCIPVMIGALRK